MRGANGCSCAVRFAIKDGTVLHLGFFKTEKEASRAVVNATSLPRPNTRAVGQGARDVDDDDEDKNEEDGNEDEDQSPRSIAAQTSVPHEQHATAPSKDDEQKSARAEELVK